MVVTFEVPDMQDDEQPIVDVELDGELDEREDDPIDDDDVDDDDVDESRVTVAYQPSREGVVGDEHTLAEIRETEAECSRRESAILELRESLKDEKKEYDAACLHLRKLCRSLTQSMPLFDSVTLTNPTTSKSDITNDAWRNAPIEDLRLESISGFGAKKREALYDLCPTIGKLEDLRAEASVACMPFATKLPKGFGEGLAEKIEDAIVRWVAKNS